MRAVVLPRATPPRGTEALVTAAVPLDQADLAYRLADQSTADQSTADPTPGRVCLLPSLTTVSVG